VEESFRAVALNRFIYLINKFKTAVTTAENMKFVVGRKKAEKENTAYIQQTLIWSLESLRELQ
jgi:hypothetical protein